MNDEREDGTYSDITQTLMGLYNKKKFGKRRIDLMVFPYSRFFFSFENCTINFP